MLQDPRAIRNSVGTAILLMNVAIMTLFVSVTPVLAQTAKPTPQPSPKPTPRKSIPKLSNGARGFDTTGKDSSARLIAIGGGYGAGEEDEPLPRLKRKTARGYYEWGLELSYRGEFNGAIAAFEKAIKLNPNYVNAYWTLGDTFSEYNNIVESDESKYDNEE